MSTTQIAPEAGAVPKTDAPRSHRSVTLLFGATILLGSALLFLVEPMVAKMLLPRLGGVPAVWNTALVFFQIVLLAGYAWTHFATLKLGLRTLIVAQGSLFAVALVVLPVAIPSGWVPDTTMPVRWALLALVVAVGLPFFALATVSPMLQRWYSHTTQRQAHDPYFLYAASNAGSLIGLAGYPLVVEPSFALADQARVWGFSFAVLVALVVMTGLTTLRLRRPAAGDAAAATAPRAGKAERHTSVRDRRRQRLRWIALAAIPSALLLGVTRHLTTDIASFPLLWVIPLAIYLATFIVAFGPNPAWLNTAAAYALKIMVIPLALTLFGFVPLAFNELSSLTIFTAAALLAHGQLASSRPTVDRLTEFYLLISVGGAVGGMLVALVAPLVFPIVLEYPLAVAAALALLPRKVFGDDSGMSTRTRVAAIVAAVAIVGVVVASIASDDSAIAMAVAATVGVAVYMTARGPAYFATGIGLVLVLVPIYTVVDTIRVDRSFFGTVEIANDEGYRTVTSGSTVHGSQSLDPVAARNPTTYYHRNGPVGDLFDVRTDGSPHSSVIVGLGAGTISAYGRPGDSLLFLEIDPLFADVASNPRYFTYLEDSLADVEIRLGDGRLLLEATDEQFDLVVLDAFTSDAIPIHLLTLEAMEVYLDRLKPGGLLAYHVSNRNIELRPVLARQAAELGLEMLAIDDGASPEDAATGKWSSTWVVIARSQADLDPFAERWSPVDIEGAPLWTDSYSNLLQVLDLW